MGAKCIACGKSLGFFSSIFQRQSLRCSECRAKIERRVERFGRLLNEYADDRFLSREEEQKLDEFLKNNHLRFSDIRRFGLKYSSMKKATRLQKIKQYEDALYNAGEEDSLSNEEYARLQALKAKLDLSEDDMAHTNRYLFHLTTLSLVEEGVLPVTDSLNLRLHKGECCHYRTFARLAEEKRNNTYAGRYDGITIRLARGVNYRFGRSKGAKVVKNYSAVTDNGCLYITNKRVVFIGARKRIAYPVRKLVSFTKYDDAVRFQREKEKRARYFKVEDQFTIEEIGAILTAVVNQA